LTLANSLIEAKKGKHLSETETVVFLGSWQGKTYKEIAKANNLSDAYLNQEVAPQVWGKLSEALGKNVNKKNFKSVIEAKISSSSLVNHLSYIAKKEAGEAFQVISDQRKAAKAFKQYVDKYKNRYGFLKLLGMPQGLALDSIYTPVRILNELSLRQFETIADLEKNYRNSDKRRLRIGECLTEDGIEVANKNQYLIVLGNPGAGKSTFLRSLGLEALKEDAGRFQHHCIPVMLELKRFASNEVDFISAIAEELTHFGFPPSKEFATKALEEGKLLVLLDGLDEVPNQFTNSVMDGIDNLVTRYENNRFIASCRIAAYRSNFQHDFKVIELADFDDDQIKQFINNWFNSELDKQSKTAEKCWETLSHESNRAAKELAQTPLLLTFLCLVYNRRQSFPPTRSRLYNKALDILLEEWAAEKRLQQEPIYEGLHTDLEKVMLAEIAYKGFKDDQLFFDEQHIVKSITDFLADSVDNPKYLDGKKILNAITAQQGILVQRAESIYSFSHLTIQEYLTAQYISNDHSRIKELVAKHLTDKRWQEVFLLVAGLKDDASKLLKLMERATQGFINTDKLHNLLAWVKSCTDDSSGDFQPVGKKTVVIANVNILANALNHNTSLANALTESSSLTNALNNANSLASALTNSNSLTIALHKDFAFAIARISAFNFALANLQMFSEALKIFIDYTKLLEEYQIYQDVNYSQLVATLEELKEQIPNDQEAKGVRQAFGKKLIKIWLKAFKLTPEMVNLSESELKALDNYFCANLLIIKCKEAAVRVSRQTWSDIESRMLIPFRDPT